VAARIRRNRALLERYRSGKLADTDPSFSGVCRSRGGYGNAVTANNSGTDSTTGITQPATIVFLLLIVPTVLWEGVVLQQLWAWFVPVVFTSAPHHVTILEASGLALIVNVVTSRSTSSENRYTARTVLESAVRSVLLGGFYLLLGLILHSLM